MKKYLHVKLATLQFIFEPQSVSNYKNTLLVSTNKTFKDKILFMLWTFLYKYIPSEATKQKKMSM